ncbi:MAG: hypothetical protein EA348_09895 [Pseudomonadaceae bacterium]|nr:MAG: hypothetical protein EA348_09895 [Pseudomonadaceae bacterium]
MTNETEQGFVFTDIPVNFDSQILNNQAAMSMNWPVEPIKQQATASTMGKEDKNNGSSILE